VKNGRPENFGQNVQ